jgi:magnesium-protoporphyrin IX monomethyl ester (oxidative) cyclase
VDNSHIPVPLPRRGRRLKDAGLPISQGFLTKAKKYHHFRPKFILYATYLSEKIGYARYIVICRHLERHPEHSFHPLFDRFEEWCNDEYRHGEAIALLIRADPKLTQGINRLWIRFFLISVYATMYCRDHMRPALHRAMGLDITDYDYQVFETCTQISRQAFPMTLDTENPRFRAAMEAMRRASVRLEAARQDQGVRRIVRRLAASVAAGWAFLRLYVVPVHANELPAHVSISPMW